MARSSARDIVSKVRRHVAQERDALALEIVYEVSRRPPLGTPVKTGWARASWIVELGSPTLSSESKRPTKADVARQQARQQAAIANLIAQGPQEPTAPAHVFNPARYVNRLNEGHSKQSPAKWFEAAVDRAVDTRSAVVRMTRVKL